MEYVVTLQIGRYHSGAMYLRKSTRKYKDKTSTSYLLVESVSTPKGPRQKTICSGVTPAMQGSA